MAQKPLDPKVKQRIAELSGLGLTHREIAGATGVSPKSVERTLTDPGTPGSRRTPRGRG